MDGGMRQRLLALVRARLERFGADHNPATVLDPEATAELTALLATVPDPAADLEIAYTAGMLHWSRYLVLDSDDDQQDFADALTWFVPVYQVRPGAVPDEARTHLARLAAANDPQTVADHAASLLKETVNAGNRAGLDAAINACRQAVAATSAGHPAHAQALSTLGDAAFNGIRAYAEQNNIKIDGLPADPTAEIPPEQALHIIHNFLAIQFPLLHPAAPSPGAAT